MRPTPAAQLRSSRAEPRPEADYELLARGKRGELNVLNRTIGVGMKLADAPEVVRGVCSSADGQTQREHAYLKNPFLDHGNLRYQCVAQSRYGLRRLSIMRKQHGNRTAWSIAFAMLSDASYFRKFAPYGIRRRICARRSTTARYPGSRSDSRTRTIVRAIPLRSIRSLA